MGFRWVEVLKVAGSCLGFWSKAIVLGLFVEGWWFSVFGGWGMGIWVFGVWGWVQVSAVGFCAAGFQG